MDTATALHVRDGDTPRVVTITTDPLDIAHIALDQSSGGTRLVCTDPDYLLALARVCNDAAEQLIAANIDRASARPAAEAKASAA